MFTGIVQEVGKIREKVPHGGAFRFRVSAPGIGPRLNVGDSVACNGVCLTAEEAGPEGFTATAVPETLARTTLGGLKAGDALNLEPALRAGDPLGGHFMQGHVDGVAEVAGYDELPGGGGRELRVRVPAEYARYCVGKGSFALAGVSLTIASLETAPDGAAVLRFALVPHTLAHTNLGAAEAGTRLNFEVDVIGKHVERLLGDRAGGARPSRLSEALLETWGYGV